MSLKTIKHTAFALIYLVCISHSARAQEETVDVKAFIAPYPADLKSPDYPDDALGSSYEGMVELNFMVDTEGQPFDMMVSSSYGPDSFIKSALRALERSKFDPAVQNGEPIIGSMTYRYTFKIKGEAQGARRIFIRNYRDFNEEITKEVRNESEIDALLALLEKIGARNHYEEAYLNLARYNRAIFFEDELTQMKFLHGALSYSRREDDQVFFDEELIKSLRGSLLLLQLKNNYFAEAINTYSLLTAMEDSEAVSRYQSAINEVIALENSDQSYSLELQAEGDGTTVFYPYKHHMYFTGGAGNISEVQLWCDRKRVAFSVERDISYDLPAEWGSCWALLISDPGAVIELVQH